MHNITFIGTSHDENGLCNSDELFRILRVIEPEVIFEEIRPADFEHFYKSNGTVETNAVKKYRNYKFVKQVPVDQYDAPENNVYNLKKKLNDIFAYVESKSPECWQLKEKIDIGVGKFGFKYLNSDVHASKWKRICEIQDEIINNIGNNEFVGILKSWRNLQNMRDFEMVKNIYDFTRKNIFNSGVFLVGATHKAGIQNEIEKIIISESNQIVWKYYN